MSKYTEYLICKVRGHTADPMSGATLNAVYGAVPKYKCQYCGTTFYTTTKTEQHEENIPLKDKNGDNNA